MKLKQKFQNLVWHPYIIRCGTARKGRVTAKIKKACDDLPPQQRLTVVTVLLSAFVLTAFFVFGNACYKMGARQAQHTIEVEHIRPIDLPTDKTVSHETAR